MSITGAVYFSGAIAVLVLGLYWDKASETGAILALFGGLIILSQGSAVAPFIYTIF